MKSSNGNSHIPSIRSVQSNYSYDYGQWLMRFNWTYILTLRRHIPLTESACMKIASNLLGYSKEIESIWLALEQDRGDQMNHLHLIIESGTLHFTRKEMIEALGIKRHPKTLSYLSQVDYSNSVAMYCAKHMGSRLIYHDFYSQKNIK